MGEQREIPIGAVAIMVVIAAIIDASQAILTFLVIGVIVNPVIDIFAAMLFGICFGHFGVSMMSPKNTLPFLGTFVGEFIPFISALPLWTLFVIGTYMKTKIEEVIEKSASNTKQSGGRWRL